MPGERYDAAVPNRYACVPAAGYGCRGALAQLVERLHGMQEVRGSNPLSSTRSETCGDPIMIIGEQVGEQAARYPWFMGSHAAGARRRGRNEGSIYKDEAKGRWYGAVSAGYGLDGKTWRR